MTEQSTTTLDQTRAFWGRKKGEILSQEDAREIVNNISAFFRVLSEWDRQKQLKEQGTLRRIVDNE